MNQKKPTINPRAKQFVRRFGKLKRTMLTLQDRLVGLQEKFAPVLRELNALHRLGNTKAFWIKTKSKAGGVRPIIPELDSDIDALEFWRDILDDLKLTTADMKAACRRAK